MKDFFVANYTFTPGGSGVGTVNLFGIRNFEIARLVAIINQTRGEVIYATGATATRYTNVSGTTVTLFYSTSTHSSADVLQIVYNYDNVKAVDADERDVGVLVREIKEDNAYTQELLNAMLALLRSVWQVGAAGSVTGSLTVRNPTAADLNVTSVISGTPAANITQIAGATTGSTTGITQPSTAGTNLVVAPSIIYHLPVLPQHIYANIGV